MAVIDTPDGIAFVQLLSIRGRLRLEIAGLKFSVPTLRNIKAMGIVPESCRTKKAALAIVEELIAEMKRAKGI